MRIISDVVCRPEKIGKIDYTIGSIFSTVLISCACKVESPGGATNTPELAHRKEDWTVDERIVSSVWREQGDTHPHACIDGWVYLTYTAFDEAVGDEVERMEIVSCRSCAEERNGEGVV
jgi:hypothetical protein